MHILLKLTLIGVAAFLQSKVEAVTQKEEDEARKYIMEVDAIAGQRYNKLSNAQWDYESNITDFNLNKSIEIGLEIALLDKKDWEKIVKFNWTEFKDYELRRIFELYSILGQAALPEDKNKALIEATANMVTNYATATICDYHNTTKCDLHLEPEILDVFSKSQNPAELKYNWVQWHHAAGIVSKGNFTEYVRLKNEAARLNNYANLAEWWQGDYEVDDFEEQLNNIWDQIKPFYDELHAYVRYHLRKKYGSHVVSATGPIPAHLLGDVWAQDWSGIYSFSQPYPNKSAVDISSAMIAQNYTAKKIFQMADDFFVSLNLSAVNDIFWNKSIIEKPTDGRDLVCHPSAWDFSDGKDFRIKQCTNIEEYFFTTTHHEMGHIQYYMQYADKPIVFRQGANQGFHEGIGDLIALSVMSTKHLKKVGLIPVTNVDDEETQMNALYNMALSKIAFLPFSLLLDTYRYAIFRGETTPDDYNCHFWDLRESLQGIQPPVERTEADFDPAAKYHVSADVEYARYYVAVIVQFQFHRALCELAGQYGQGSNDSKLVDCDIYKNTKAGNQLGKMLRMGLSRPWPDAMEVLTGQRNMDSSGLFAYFQPLYDWLKKKNQVNGAFVGWTPSTVKYCTNEQKVRLMKRKSQRYVEKMCKCKKTSYPGNIWGQSWSSVESFSRPYPNKADVDVTGAMVAQNYTAMKMFEMSDEFFQSLNLTAMPPKFWQNSIIEKPNDGRELVCHASAWKFYDGEDFRIKQCTSITENFFQTTYHEMGHIQYYLQYKDQPVIFRGGANPGFHEAVGDVIALSVSSTKHLKKVGLIPEENADDEETQINQLYRMGLEKIAFLPFAYMLDLFCYSVFRGESTTSDYNCRYWQLRESIQGLEPPVERSEDDFDAAAKYHVSADVEYARYYVSFVVQFQFHQALCSLAGEFVAGDANKRLVDCDIYNSTNAGNALSKMLSMGSSRPWPDAMEVLTGQRDMDAGGLFEYFQPLYDWLKKENEKNGAHIGWTSSTVRYFTDEQKSRLPVK